LEDYAVTTRIAPSGALEAAIEERLRQLVADLERSYPSAAACLARRAA